MKIQIVRHHFPYALHHVLWRFFYFRRSTDEDIELINKKLGPPGPEPKGQSGPRTARSHQYRQYKKPPGPSAPGPHHRTGLRHQEPALTSLASTAEF
jgi:hypothetical protein